MNVLLENGDKLLLEDGSFLLMEDVSTTTPVKIRPRPVGGRRRRSGWSRR